MANFGSSARSKKLVIVGTIVVIAALAGTVLRMSHTSSNQGNASKDIALTMAKAIHSGNSRSCQHLWSKDNVDKSAFAQIVSPRVQEYGPIKEVALVSQEDVVVEGYPTKTSIWKTKKSSWKVTAKNGSYTIMTNVKDGELVGCRLILPSGESIVTGSF